MHPGASDGIQVSVKTRMSNAPSCMLSFMRAALLTADLELSRPKFHLFIYFYIYGLKCKQEIGLSSKLNFGYLRWRHVSETYIFRKGIFCRF